MQRTPATVLLMHGDPLLARSVTAVADPPIVPVAVEGWDALAAALAKLPPSTVAVVDPFHASGGDAPADALRWLLRTEPTPVVLAALEVTPERAAAVRTLLTWELADVLDLLRERTPAAVGRRLQRARGQVIHRIVARALPRGVPGRAAAVLDVAADVVAAGGRAPELAGALGIHERTLPRWCDRVGLPPARRLLAWLRLLLATDLLERSGRSTEAVARACGYAGAASLKSALLNLVGATPRDLRRPGAFAGLAERFERELFDLRERARAAADRPATWLG
jgi:AraC-like DNA-binding protein